MGILFALAMIFLGANSAVSAFIASRNIGIVHSEGTYYELDGTRLFVRELGEGRPLMIIHDFSDSGFTHFQIAQMLSEGRSVYLVDLPGLGFSGLPADEDFRISNIANTLKKLLEELRIGEVDLLGHSSGGLVALSLAQQHPGLVRSIVLVNTPISSTSIRLPDWLSSDRLFSRFVMKHIYRTYSLERSAAKKTYHNKDAFDSERFLMEYSLSYWVSTNTILRYYDQNRDHLPDGLREIRIPVLLVWGAHDVSAPLEEAHELNSSLRNSMLMVMDNCGRYPMYENQPAFINHVQSFLRSVR